MERSNTGNKGRGQGGEAKRRSCGVKMWRKNTWTGGKKIRIERNIKAFSFDAFQKLNNLIF